MEEICINLLYIMNENYNSFVKFVKVDGLELNEY